MKSTAEGFNQASLYPLEQAVFRLRSASFSPKHLAKKSKELLSNFPRENVSVLEVGANQGAKTPLIYDTIQELGASIQSFTGIDIAEKPLEIARERNPNVKYFQGDFVQDEPNTSYDYVFLAAVWHHFEDTRKAIQRIEESLKSGGVAFILNTFEPGNFLGSLIGKGLHEAYKLLEKRDGVYYHCPKVSDFPTLVEETELDIRGEFLAGILPAILNTRMIVLQKNY